MSEEGLERLREQVSAADRAIVEALNRRIELVAQIRRYKEKHGLEFLDPGREARMFEELRSANTGPLSDDGLERLLREVLDLSKRETA